MAEIRVVREGGGMRRWLWLPLVLLLAVGAWFLLDRRNAQETTAARTDTTSTVSAGALDTAANAPAAPGATPMAPSPAQVGDTAPGAPPTERAGEASRAGAARVAAPGPGPRTP
jgi:hypothetical protein